MLYTNTVPLLIFMDLCTDTSLSPHIHFTLFIIFLTLFLNLLGLQATVLKATAGSWFQSWMVLFTKEYFPLVLQTLYNFCGEYSSSETLPEWCGMDIAMLTGWL
jgi:hypothetical protein